MSSHSDSCKQLSMKSNPGTYWLSHLIIEWHQQSLESTNRCCHDIIHCIIQWEAQQEEKPSVKQQTDNAALQGGSKLSGPGLKCMPHKSQCLSCLISSGYISTFCVFTSSHFYCKAAKLCAGGGVCALFSPPFTLQKHATPVP